MAKGTLPRGPLYARPIRPPLARWFDALAARRRGPVDVVCIGDSITEGTGASDRTTRWLDRLQDGLRTAYPTPSVVGGAGYIPCYTMADYPPGWTYGGNIAANGTFGLGRRSVVLKSPDGFCERYVSGTSVTVAWTSGPGLGSFDVLVDGTVATTVNTGTGSNARGGNRATVTFSRGSHLVRLRWSAGGDCYVNGLFVRDGDEARGIRFTDSGQHGSSSADWSRLINPATAYIIGDELAAIAPSLVLIGLGANDMIQGLSPASHKANLLDLIAQVRASVPVDSTGRGVPILLHAPYQLAADYTYPWSSYVQNMIDIAYADAQIDLIDFSARLPRANANPDAMIAADGIHPNDTGHAYYATQLRDRVAPHPLPRHDYVSTWGSVAQTVTGVKTFTDGVRVPAPSNAADPVRNDDARLSNARTPSSHASTHASGGSDPVTPAAIGAAADSAVVHNTGTETINGAKTFSTPPAVPVGNLLTHPVRRDDARLSDARTPTAHSHDSTPATNTVVQADTSLYQAAASPIPNFLWHDLLRFNHFFGAPTVETSPDGTTWTAQSSTSLINDLFSGKQATSYQATAGAGQRTRWTWNSSKLIYCFAQWMVLTFQYDASLSKTVTVESSSDGTTWRTLHTATGTWNSAPSFHWLGTWVQGNYGDSRLRLTIVQNGTTAGVAGLALSQVQLLTQRDDGYSSGLENSLPYNWDSAKRIGLGGIPDATARLKVYGSVIADSFVGSLPAHASTHASNGSDPVTPAAIGAAAASHSHAIGDLPVAASGTSSSTQLVRADDARLSDARSPNAHASTHASGGSDPVTPAAIGAAASAHVHSGADVTTGTVGYARLPVGTAASTVAAGDDARFTNARTPTAHASTHASGGSDPVTPTAIGAAAASHSHAIGDLPVAASGTSSTTQLVRADDARLSNARTPSTHASTHASGGSDPITPAAIAAAAAVHAAQHASGGSDPITPAAIGAALAAHNHDTRYQRTFHPAAYGAVGNGTTDDAAALNAAITDAATVNGIVQLGAYNYGTLSPVEVPENVEVRGWQTGRITYSGAAAPISTIKALAGHSGPAVIRLRGRTETSRTYEHTGAKIRNVMVDGSSGPASLKGIALYALVREAVIEDCLVYKCSDAGFWAGAGATATTTMPQSLRVNRCVAHQNGGAGFSFSNVPDSILTDCLSIGNGWVGFYLAGFIHGKLIGCNAEWNTQHGYFITSGYYGSGTGSGGLLIIGSSTDRNASNGIYIDATGNAAILLVGMLLRRDGRNGGTGGGGYAGLFVATTATVPVRATAIGVYPGVDDDGTQTASPQIGVSATGAAPSVTVTDGEVHAVTTAVAAGSGAVISPAVGQTTGPTNAPVRVAPRALVATDDARLSNARTPSAHASTHASGGSDPVTPAAIGAATASHSHAIADLPVATSGTSSSTQLVRADDARLSNARTPSTHASTHASGGSDPITPASIAAAAATHASQHASGGSDPVTPAAIGAAASAHTHAIADLPVATSGTSSSTQLVRADDARLSNARTPSTHASTHASGGSDPVTPAAIGAAASSHSHAIADLPVAASGTSSTTALVRADDSRLSDARTPVAHTHAIADLPVAASGTSSTTQLVRADDARLSNTRTPSAHAASHATGGTDPITPASIGAAPAGVTVTNLGTISQGTLTPSATAPNQKATISAAATLAVPATPGDGYLVNLVVLASGATLVLTLSGSYGVMSGQPTSLQIPVGKQCQAFMRYNVDTARWVILSFTVEA